MRAILAILCFCMCGCDFMKGGGSTPTTEISDASGQHRLMMRCVPVRGGYDFDALLWRSRDGTTWKHQLMITRADFEKGGDRERWVSAIHSFDPATGHAIIKVAEGDAPRTAGTVNFIYSWREWNLLKNCEVRMLRICKSPFEEY